MEPGQYTITDDLTYLEIRSARSTSAASVGKYYKNDTFTVYQVFPETLGIVWGRVCENVSGAMRYVGMRVNNHDKVAQVHPEIDTSADMMIMKHERELSKLIEWARTKGYTG